MSKNTSRRVFLRYAAIGTGTLALAACGGSTTTTGGETAATSAAGGETAATSAAGSAATSAPAASSGAAMEISYWGGFSGDLGKAEQAMVDSFNESQKDVKVTLQPHANYEEVAQKVTAALQAKNTPEIALLSDVWWFKFYTAQALAPMNDLMKAANVDTSDYVDVLINEGTRKGTTYWVPFARSTPLFYYNKDAWAEAGLPDRGPETWTEFLEWAPKLVKTDGGQTRSAFAHPNAGSYIAWLFQGVIWQFGGSYSDADFNIKITEPNGIKAGQFYADSVKNKWAVPTKDVNQDFATGLAASTMASTGGLTSIQKNAQFNVGTAFLPKMEAFGCPTGGSGLAILAAASPEKQAAAMQYIAYATSTEGALKWSQTTGYMPVRKSAISDQRMQDFFAKNPNFKTAVDQLPQTKPQDAARVYIPGGDQTIGKGLERITVTGDAVDAAFGDVAKQLQTDAQPVVEAVKAIEG